MPDPTTPAKNLTQPTVGGDNNTWGGLLNTNLSLIDSALGGTLAVSISGNTTLNPTQGQNGGYHFTGSLLGTATITFPAFSGMAAIRNDTTGGFSIVCGISGATVTVANGETVAVWSDGTDFTRLSQIGGGVYPIKPTVRIVCSPDTRLFTTYAPNGSVYNTSPANWTQGPLDVLGTANNGSGLIRLQLASTSQIRTGDNITVAGVQGTTEANGDWNNVTVVDGTHVDLPGSTYTHTFSGGGGIVVPNNSWLQDAINFAVDGGYSLVIEAQGGRNSDNSVGPTTLCSRGPINIPTALFLSVDFSSVEIYLAGTDGFVFDIWELSGFKGPSILGYVGDGAAIHFKPSNPSIVDGALATNDSDFEFGAVVVQGSSNLSGRCINFDLTGGSFFQSRVRWRELFGGLRNGGGIAANLVAITNVGTTVSGSPTRFSHNQLSGSHAHGFTANGFDLGLSTTNQTDIYGNTYEVAMVAPWGASANGFSIYGTDETVIARVTSEEHGGYNSPAIVQSGAVNARLFVNATGNSVGITNSGTETLIYGNGAFQSKVKVNGSGDNNPGLAATGGIGSTGAIGGYNANTIYVDNNGSSASRIQFTGTNSSTNGTLALTSTRSNGSNPLTNLTLNADGGVTSRPLGVTGGGISGYGSNTFFIDQPSPSSFRIQFTGTDNSTNGTLSLTSVRANGTNSLTNLGLNADGTVSVLSNTPASSSAAGITGSVTWDSNFLYVCVATNTWKRVAISSW